MELSTRLADSEAQAVVDHVLRQHWRDIGFDHAKVQSGTDVYGDPALFVTAVLRSGTPVLPAERYSAAALAMQDALLSEGEPRYAYLRLTRPDEPIVEDGGAEES